MDFFGDFIRGLRETSCEKQKTCAKSAQEMIFHIFLLQKI
jgi:hypothetical protein